AAARGVGDAEILKRGSGSLSLGRGRGLLRGLAPGGRDGRGPRAGEVVGDAGGSDCGPAELAGGGWAGAGDLTMRKTERHRNVLVFRILSQGRGRSGGSRGG